MVKPCRFFLVGFCRDGLACRFKHTPARQRPPPPYNAPAPPPYHAPWIPTSRGPPPFPPLRKEKPRLCKYFVKGFCRDGRACRWDHHEPMPMVPRYPVLPLERPAKRQRTSAPIPTLLPPGARVDGLSPVIAADKMKPTKCKYYVSARGCRDGDSCLFLHYADAPPASAALRVSAREMEARKFNRTCKHWVDSQHGGPGCRAGEGCPFLHCYTDLVPKTCPDLLRRGTCTYGDACKFLHGDAPAAGDPGDDRDFGQRRGSSPLEEPPAAYEAVSKGLPPGWEQKETKDGRHFYVNHNTRTTTWKRPE